MTVTPATAYPDPKARNHHCYQPSPEQGVTDHAVGDETEVDSLIVLTLGKRHGAVGTVGILLRITRVARGRGVACGNREDNLVVLLARVRDDPIDVRHQVRELIHAVGVRGHSLHGVTIQVDNRVASTVRQGDGNAGDTGLVRILDAVLVRVKPHEVTQRRRLHEREVDLVALGAAAVSEIAVGVTRVPLPASLRVVDEP